LVSLKSLVKSALGFNAASLVHLARLDTQAFASACQSAWRAAWKDQAPLSSSVEALPDIPGIDLGSILGDRKPVVRMPVQRYEDGMLPSNQAMVLLAILVAEAPAEVMEIGTFMGHTTRLMAENLPNAIIHTVDLPLDFRPENDTDSMIPKDDFHLISARKPGREFRDRPCAERIRQHFVDTAKWDFREAGHPTCFFIDGSHTYEYCKNDSEKCFEACGGRGVFLWHDCDPTHPGVVRFLDEWREMGRDIRVIDGTPIAYWKSI
jgi:hypothetical protein